MPHNTPSNCQRICCLLDKPDQATTEIQKEFVLKIEKYVDICILRKKIEIYTYSIHCINWYHP